MMDAASWCCHVFSLQVGSHTMAILARMRRAQGTCLIEATEENLSWLYKCSRSRLGNKIGSPPGYTNSAGAVVGNNGPPPSSKQADFIQP